MATHDTISPIPLPDAADLSLNLAAEYAVLAERQHGNWPISYGLVAALIRRCEYERLRAADERDELNEERERVVHLLVTEEEKALALEAKAAVLHRAFRAAAEVRQTAEWPPAAREVWGVLYEAVEDNDAGLRLLAENARLRAALGEV